jgi:hypothetical protein
MKRRHVSWHFVHSLPLNSYPPSTDTKAWQWESPSKETFTIPPQAINARPTLETLHEPSREVHLNCSCRRLVSNRMQHTNTCLVINKYPHLVGKGLYPLNSYRAQFAISLWEPTTQGNPSHIWFHIFSWNKEINQWQLIYPQRPNWRPNIIW